MEEFVCINKNQSGSQYEGKIYTFGKRLWADPELIEDRKLFISAKIFDEKQKAEALEEANNDVPDNVKLERANKKAKIAEDALASEKEAKLKAEEETKKTSLDYQALLKEATEKGYKGDSKKAIDLTKFLESVK